MSSPSALAFASDPEGPRLSGEAVVAINQAHLEGTGWDEIARRHGTTRKNVQRIVQGRRWKNLHPTTQPALYHEQQESEPDVGSFVLRPGDPAAIVALRVYAQVAEDLGHRTDAVRAEQALARMRG